MRTWLWIGATIAGLVFYAMTYRVARRVRRVRAEVRRLRAVRRAYELEQEADAVLGIG